LIQTGGKNWLAHRMKEQARFSPKDMAPMLATHGSVERFNSVVWAFEGNGTGTACWSTQTTECSNALRQWP